MSETFANPAIPAAKAKGEKRRRGRGAIILVAALVLLGGGGAAAYLYVPGAAALVAGLLPAKADEHASVHPGFIELPEMTVTLTNGGRPRQLKLTLALEVAGDPALLRPDVVTPRLYDGLVTYLRTLRDGELEGALALDRLRADLFRRVDLLLGPGVLRDVLVTGFVVA
ncbi:flagellar basal body-associated FliL family protein [Paracraurococcus ruber]|uniref:Flagellar protein FliL n=1 Tax=Paracraurococcus ruber TaxID=77675 RepID=A0ABS1CZT0_9PROT|nr:flagellar basal body-associated FliL family protein [Paracraurococcus ruber]MBK1660027.1 flagellar basal body protein FliL [Paracraurococcus ruber]TDG28628.1 flagellar basal body protein FliL [Paracraurococcus ruber]